MKQFTGFMHGINLGGWFSQCDNTEKRYEYFIRRDDFKRIARWGLDHVRIPLDYNLILNQDGSFKEHGFKRLADAVAWSRENGLNVVLDLHKTPGFSFDSGECETGFFEDEAFQETFYRIWEELAKRFGNDTHVAFELLNEVTDKAFMPAWNRIAGECTKRIRKYAPETKVLFGGYYNNAVEAVKDLAMPFDENVVYNFHCYSPHIFTHQGAYWIPTMKTDFRMPFDSTNAVYRENTAKYMPEGSNMNFGEDDGYITEAYFEKEFREAIAVAEERGVPLYCGEYGVIDLANAEDAVKWYACITKVLDRYGIGRAAWSYKEMDFGLIEAHFDDVRERILKLL